MSDPATRQPGIFGKIPTHGDFITRQLPASFIDHWDLWLQGAISDSRDQLGDAWLDIYLTSPIWRFVLSPGAAGQSAWAGVLMPSVDRVGRYFPLTLAAPLAAPVDVLRTMSGSEAWFKAAETLVLSCLGDGFDLDAFSAKLAELGPPAIIPSAAPVPSMTGSGTDTPDATAPAAGAWRVAVPPSDPVQAAYPTLLAQALGDLFFSYSLWWTEGSERVSPSVLACQGLPPIERFSALLAGDWNHRGWRDAAVIPWQPTDPSAGADPT